MPTAITSRGLNFPFLLHAGPGIVKFLAHFQERYTVALTLGNHAGLNAQTISSHGRCSSNGSCSAHHAQGPGADRDAKSETSIRSLPRAPELWPSARLLSQPSPGPLRFSHRRCTALGCSDQRGGACSALRARRRPPETGRREIAPLDQASRNIQWGKMLV